MMGGIALHVRTSSYNINLDTPINRILYVIDYLIIRTLRNGTGVWTLEKKVILHRILPLYVSRK